MKYKRGKFKNKNSIEHRKIFKKWNKKNHFGQCGQSCPCCRWILQKEILGSCEFCKKNEI